VYAGVVLGRANEASVGGVAAIGRSGAHPAAMLAAHVR